MRLHQLRLSAQDEEITSSTVTLLGHRLNQKTTIDWALNLDACESAKRIGILRLLNGPEGLQLGEPWRTAWRLIEESWEHQADAHFLLTGVHDAKRRLSAGERSGALVSSIVELVAPRLEIKAYESWELRLIKLPCRPRTIRHLFRVALTSGSAIDPRDLGLHEESDRKFLISLSHALEAAVVYGLDVLERINWTRAHLLVNRAYFIPESARDAGMAEPDQDNEGLAPSVKLLHAVVSRLVDIDSTQVSDVVGRWKLSKSAIHPRLWAAIAHDPRVTAAEEVADFLLDLETRKFWDIDHHPEILELRARRYEEMPECARDRIVKKIRRGPPLSFLRERMDPAEVERGRLYWTVRELRRIEIAGGKLPARDATWLHERLHEFPDLKTMDRVDDGFMTFPSEGELVARNPDASLDSLKGRSRLEALEKALSGGPASAGGSSRRAIDWLETGSHAVEVLRDLESCPEDHEGFARVWAGFCRAHSPTEGEDLSGIRDLHQEAGRVLALHVRLSPKLLSVVGEDFTQWLLVWKDHLGCLHEWSKIWHRLWRISLQALNVRGESEGIVELSIVRTATPTHSSDFTLNTAVGKLVEVFLGTLPSLHADPHPFDGSAELRRMREAMAEASQFSGLIAKQRMVQHIEYFLAADRAWTTRHLIEPLTNEDEPALLLWRSIGLRTRFTGVLKIIGNQVADRVTDTRLDRETRRSLAFSLVVECLHAQCDRREPAVRQSRVQQVIRSVEVDLRAYCARALVLFMGDVSKQETKEARERTPEGLFLRAIRPFLLEVWPQERSLTSSGLSRELAKLPAAARHQFAEAVGCIERFLMPFDCWSMLDFGLAVYKDDAEGEGSGLPGLAMIDDETKAGALLRLIDRSVGAAENSVVPHNLGDALDQVERVAPSLAKEPSYRRLAAACRRG